MFEVVLKQTVKKLEKAKAQGLLQGFALIGGLAVSRWSVARATVDIDFIIALGGSGIEKLAEFVGGKCQKGDVRDPLRGSITFEAQERSGPVPVQMLEFPKSWEEIAFRDVGVEKIGDLKLPIVDWKGLVLLKLYAGSALDLQDARNVLKTVAPGKKELADLEKTAQTLRVSKKLEKVLANSNH